MSVPISIDRQEVVRAWISKIMAHLRGVEAKFSFQAKWRATYTDPWESIIHYTSQNAADLLGKNPNQFISLWGTDGRFLRQSAIPTAIYGPSMDTMATFNEFINNSELLQVAKVHAGAALDYLWSRSRAWANQSCSCGLYEVRLELMVRMA